MTIQKAPIMSFPTYSVLTLAYVQKINRINTKNHTGINFDCNTALSNSDCYATTNHAILNDSSEYEKYHDCIVPQRWIQIGDG